jgi:hypothetical protein
MTITQIPSTIPCPGPAQLRQLAADVLAAAEWMGARL